MCVEKVDVVSSLNVETFKWVNYETLSSLFVIHLSPSALEHFYNQRGLLWHESYLYTIIRQVVRGGSSIHPLRIFFTAP